MNYIDEMIEIARKRWIETDPQNGESWRYQWIDPTIKSEDDAKKLVDELFYITLRANNYKVEDGWRLAVAYECSVLNKKTYVVVLWKPNVDNNLITSVSIKSALIQYDKETNSYIVAMQRKLNE